MTTLVLSLVLNMKNLVQGSICFQGQMPVYPAAVNALADFFTSVDEKYGKFVPDVDWLKKVNEGQKNPDFKVLFLRSHWSKPKVTVELFTSGVLIVKNFVPFVEAQKRGEREVSLTLVIE